MHQNDNGFIQQITLTALPTLPVIPEEDGVRAESIGFYNPELCGCYYVNGAFYENEELTIAISDPANYVKPYIEPEKTLYTLDEAADILAQEVANEL